LSNVAVVAAAALGDVAAVEPFFSCVACLLLLVIGLFCRLCCVGQFFGCHRATSAMTIATTAATSLKIALPTATLSHRAATTAETKVLEKYEQTQQQQFKKLQ